MRKTYKNLLIILVSFMACSWGWRAHYHINEKAIECLDSPLKDFYAPHASYLKRHSMDPDRRRRRVEGERERHFIDLDFYLDQVSKPQPPYSWSQVRKLYSQKDIRKNGILPWNILDYMKKLTTAFEDQDEAKILQLSAEIGHYISDAHVPLHTNSNYDGQKTNQEGIHSLWETELPAIFLNSYCLPLNKARYIEDQPTYIWDIIYNSFALSQVVLKVEKELSNNFPADKKYEAIRTSKKIRIRHSKEYAESYHERLNKMVETQLEGSIEGTASLWLTAWMNAGRPALPSAKTKKQQNLKQKLGKTKTKW